MASDSAQAREPMMAESIFITSPEEGDTVPRTFTVSGTYSTEHVSPMVNCVITYQDGSTFTQGPQQKPASWTYDFGNAPATAAGQQASLMAYLLDSTGQEITNYGPVHITIRNP